MSSKYELLTHSPSWMCRLADSGALGVAGFERVGKYKLEVETPD